MKILFRIIRFLVIACILLIGLHLFYLYRMQAKEVYTEDTYLLQEKNKVALVIVAHDDDAISCAGTLSKLCAEGWTIRESCFYSKWGGDARDSVRKESLKKAAQMEGLSGIDFHEFAIRNDLKTNETPYKAMPVRLFDSIYRLDSISEIIKNYIHKYRPSVILTLDDSIGGYGHPDHVVVSRMVLKYCMEHKNDSGFSVRKIYQPVFTPSMAEAILGEGYQQAKKIYECNGMPLPDVQVKISEKGEQKKQAMLVYTTEQNSLRKFWPYYHWYPSSVYFKIFDREFFRVIDLN